MVGRNERTGRILYYRLNCHRHSMHSRDQFRPHDADLGVPLWRLPTKFEEDETPWKFKPSCNQNLCLNVSLRVPPCLPPSQLPLPLNNPDTTAQTTLYRPTNPSKGNRRLARSRLPTDPSMDLLCVYSFDVLVSELEKRAPIPFPAAHLAKTNPKLLTNGEAETHDIVSIDTN